MSHYTDWELDDEEIEDVSLTELPESPDRHPPRLPASSAVSGATAASHYFLSAGDGEEDEDEDGDEFFIQPGLATGDYSGGSSFTPGEMFPGDGDVWGTGAARGDAWGRVEEEDVRGEGGEVDVWGNSVMSEPAAPEGRFIDVWARGGAGVAEEVVSPDVVEKPIVSTASSAASAVSASQKPVADDREAPATDDASESTAELVTTLDPPRPLDETAAVESPAEAPSRVMVEDSLTSDAAGPEGSAQDGAAAAGVTGQRLGESEGAERTEAVGATESAPMESCIEDQSTEDKTKSTTGDLIQSTTGDLIQSSTEEKIQSSTEDRIQSTAEDRIQSTESGMTTPPSAPAAPAAGASLTNSSLTESPSTATATSTGDSGASTGASTGDSPTTESPTASENLTQSAPVEASILTEAPAPATVSSSGAAPAGTAPVPDTDRPQARPARDKLFLDLTGAPADTVDSGYTGSCDDRTVAAFVALDGLAE